MNEKPDARPPAWRGYLRCVFGRQQDWEDSPSGWPVTDDFGRVDGRPRAQLSRLKAGRSDDLG